MANDSIDPAVIVAAVTAGKAITGGALITALRLPNPAKPDEGIVVHLYGDEQKALTETLRAILARRLEI